MKKGQDHNSIALYSSHIKDSASSQLLLSKNYWENHTVCLFMAASASGIPIQNICRYADLLHKSKSIDTLKTFCDVIGCRRTIGGISWIASNGTIGTTDISITIAGRLVRVIAKIAGDHKIETQKTYQSVFDAPGSVCFMVTSLGQFFAWYESFKTEPKS